MLMFCFRHVKLGYGTRQSGGLFLRIGWTFIYFSVFT